MNAFRMCHMTVEDEIVAGDTVVVRWTVTGTHRGELSGLPPTGEKHFAEAAISMLVCRRQVRRDWTIGMPFGMISSCPRKRGKLP